MEPNITPAPPEPVPQAPAIVEAAPPPTPTAPTREQRTVSPVVVIAGVIIVLIIGSIIFASRPKPKQTIAPTPTPTETPTPTPVRQLSALASQSAFLIYETSIASLSASIQRYNTQDPMLSPPVLTLPLGFSR